MRILFAVLCLFLLAVSSLCFSANIAYAQNINEERLEQLEQEVLLLKRQQQRSRIDGRSSLDDSSSDKSSESSSDGSNARNSGNSGGDLSTAHIDVRLGILEDELRNLRGQIEEKGFADQNLAGELERFKRDAEFRISELEKALQASQANQAAIAEKIAEKEKAEAEAKKSKKQANDAKTKDTIAKDAAAKNSQNKIEQTKTEQNPPEKSSAGKYVNVENYEQDADVLNSESKKQSSKMELSVQDISDLKNTSNNQTLGKPLVTSSANSVTKPSDSAAEKSAEKSAEQSASEAKETPREQYNRAFQLLNQTRYEEASARFEDFIKKYPKDPLVGNAYYWQGEVSYIKKNYAEAIDKFRSGYDAMPKGPKAADNLLKLGMSLALIKQHKESCIVLSQVMENYKSASSNVAGKAANEYKKNGCSQ